MLNGMMVRHQEQVCSWMGEKIKARRDIVGSGEEDELKPESEGEKIENGKVSDAETIDDPTATTDDANAGGNVNGNENGQADTFGPLLTASAGTALPQLGRTDVVMTTEQS